MRNHNFDEFAYAFVKWRLEMKFSGALKILRIGHKWRATRTALAQPAFY